MHLRGEHPLTRRSKDALKRELRELAVRDGKVANFRCGIFEVLRIAYEAHCYVEDVNIKDRLILAGLRSTEAQKRGAS